MLRSVRVRIQSQRGFTLVELLVVTMIIGVLAGIGLPAFLGAQTKGNDISAKSDARNVMSAVESCFTETHDYEKCDSVGDLNATDTKTGVELTDTTTKKKGAVSISATDDTFSIAGYSMSGNTFVVEKAADGTFTRNW